MELVIFLVSSLILGIDKFFVASMCSTAQYEIYVTGALELPLISIVAQSVDAVLAPEVSRLRRQRSRHPRPSRHLRPSPRSSTRSIPTRFRSRSSSR